MTDQDALDHIRRGGRDRVEGISHLYRAYARRFEGYFRKHRVTPQQAEELVQDVFESIVRHCDGFRGGTRVDAWMWAIVRNALVDHVRRQRPETAMEPEDLEALVDEVSSDAAALAGGSDLRDCVRDGLRRFAQAYPDRAEILTRIAVDGWSNEDVAIAIGRTAGATREYLSQCRKKVRPYLEPCWELLAG
jgi:RNA polymerase sigma-70 factor (ECF subfamily)